MEEILEESETVDKVFFPRLGTCAQCKKNEAKYTCPRCGIRTCCLNCVKAHKQVNECDGIRDKTAYKPLSVFTDLDLLSDYRLLEELGRSTDNLNRDPTKRHTRQNKDLPLHLHKLRGAAGKRGIQLRFQPTNFSRNKENTTFLDWKTQKIAWRVEWRFTWTDTKAIDERLPEETILGEALRRHIDFHHSELGEIAEPHVFLQAEHLSGESGRFYDLDLTQSLTDNLRGKILIEFPILRVVADPSKLGEFPLVGSGPPVQAGSRKNGGEPAAKKSKLTFYEVSDGELSDSD